MALRRSRSWTPKAIPFGVLILLLGAWAFFVPLVGGYFNFGFASNSEWDFSSRQWELQLAPGIAAALGGYRADEVSPCGCGVHGSPRTREHQQDSSDRCCVCRAHKPTNVNTDAT